MIKKKKQITGMNIINKKAIKAAKFM